MGSVYQLIPLMPSMPVLALKTYQGAINFEQFSEEARIWISLGTHPNIAKAISFGEMNGTLCIVATWYAHNMHSIDPRLMKYNEICSFVHGIIEGLEYGQKVNQLIHKDIKPANILIDKNNNPRIADFGISSASSPSDRDIATYKSTIDLKTHPRKLGRAVCGTPYYMAPELYSGDNNSVKSDIFALGVTLFDWLTGEHPYQNIASVFDPDRISALLHAVSKIYGRDSEPLIQMMRMAVRLDPELRPSSFSELKEKSKFAAYEFNGKQENGRRVLEVAADIVSTAQVLRRQGRIDEAIKVLQDGIDSSPEDSMLLSAYATTLIRIGKSDIARTYLEKAVIINSGNGNVYSGSPFIEPNINLSLLHIEDRRFKDAETLLENTFKTITRDANLFENLYWEFAWLSLFQGKIEESRHRLLLHVANHAPNVYVLALSCLVAFLAPDRQAFFSDLFKKISSHRSNSTLEGVYLRIIGSQLEQHQLKYIDSKMIGDEHSRNIRVLAKKMTGHEQAFDGPVSHEVVLALLREADGNLTGGMNRELF